MDSLPKEASAVNGQPLPNGHPAPNACFKANRYSSRQLPQTSLDFHRYIFIALRLSLFLLSN